MNKIDLLYPSPYYREEQRSKKKLMGILIIIFLLGVAFGSFNYDYPKSEQIYVLDPIEIPQGEEIENELEIISIYAQGQKEISFDYWTEDKNWDLYIHIHNDTLTEFYFDQDLKIITNESYTYVIHEPFEILLIDSEYLVFITFWFWEKI